ncbi:ParB/RepB/Spo0J family partition protein [uncultured Oscillibacter sp.]|uniref:ParB/RepB/Spo0J family partition protein n=1 Tax=uncultured Oscillibacter sp. TaxID=876091 RepID=UPI00345BB27D
MADEKLNVSPEENPQPRDATRAEKEEIVYLNLSELFPFKDHSFGVRDDAEMKGLVASVKDNGVHQPALVRPREGGGYEIIAGHRRQRASELAGFANMPCIVRNMTDDNLRHREKILPMEKAQSLKMQVEAISHQGTKMEGVAAGEIGKRSTEIVGERNGMNYNAATVMWRGMKRPRPGLMPSRSRKSSDRPRLMPSVAYV